MSRAVTQTLRLILIFLPFLYAWAGSHSYLRLSAQELPAPPETFSILESSTKFDESLPLPSPPEESPTDAIPEPPSTIDLSLEPEPMSAPEAKTDDPFASLFRDPNDATTNDPPATPSELIGETAVNSFEELLPKLNSDRRPLPTLKTDQGYEVLLAGPVHEALLFNMHSLAKELEPIVVTKAPPAKVKEQAPQAGASVDKNVPQFVGNNAEWIEGYWAWFKEAERFVWVSGLYRDIPPGRVWVAGKWTETNAGYRWTSGYWAEASISVAVAPVRQAPPPPRETEPQSAPPDEDSFWIAGQWLVEQPDKSTDNSTAELKIAREAKFQWQPGFWSKRSKEWIWQPSRYINTPAGYVYVSGYWDYEPHFRGQPFAPVIFDLQESSDAGIVFQPIYPLSRPAAVLLHLFTKSDSIHVYYGDFYDRTYAELGYRLWYETRQSDSAEEGPLDPLLNFYRWKYRNEGLDFTGSMERFANHFRSAPSIRPAMQLKGNPQLADREGLAGEVNAGTFDEIVRGKVGELAAVMLDGSEQRSDAEQRSDIANLSRDQPDSSESAAGRPANNSSGVSTASAFVPLQAGRTNVTNGQETQQSQPRGAMLGLGTNQLMVLPGGRVIVAPANGPLGPPVPPPGMRMPSPPLPPGVFGSRLRRR
jgi:hypothetical protein